jgi:predicted ATPase/transcriptional regulator with XRE-family HTH domain
MPDLYPLPDTFPTALRFLRKRARLTQDELGRAVGYSREQIARLENGSRLPDLAVIAALFVPALFERHERGLAEQFLALAGQTRRDQQVTITHTSQTRLEVTSQAIGPAAPAAPAYRPPAPLLPLIGRGEDVAGLLALLDEARLLTIVGAPGVGKSRLALEVANCATAAFPDGAAFVPLADAASAADAPYAVLRALGLIPAAGQPVEESIASYLAPRRLLLVLDNCEHILEAAPNFADWLARSPGLRLLCTSRVPLDLYGEQEWPLAPLVVPDLATPPDLVRWGKAPAMQLLVARGRAMHPDFALTADNLLPLATLCAALDGLPLALELAAVRLRDLPPAELAQQLLAARGRGQLSSTWLQQTRRNIAERHRTLQAAIDWSVRMLPPAQANAFCRLGVFAGGCSEAAAQAVVAATTADAGPDALAALARANLIARADDRVTLLETLRAYAVERLAAAGDLAAAQRRHAAYFVAFTGEVFAGLLGDDQVAWMRAALADHDNFLTALRWALAAGDGETAIALAGNLWWFWYRRGLFALGQELLEAALRLTTADRSARARALNGLASIHLALDDPAASLACHEEGLALRRELNDPLGIATALHNMGLTAYVLGDFAQAIAWLNESIAADPTADPAQAWAHIGIIALDTLDLAESRRWLERAYAATQPAPAGWLHAFVASNLADTLWECGERGQARQLAEASLHLFEALGDEHYTTDPCLLLARIAAAEGDLAGAQALAAHALAEYEARPDSAAAAGARLLQAELALTQGDTDQSAALAAAALAQRRSVARPLTPREAARYAAVMSRADASLTRFSSHDIICDR